MYSAYAFPNIVLPLFGGYIIDRLGVRAVLIGTYCICLLGNIIFAIGGSNLSYTTILVGRSIFGIGNETCSIAVTVLITKWFIGGRLNLAYALNGVALGFSGFAAGITSPMLFGSAKDPHLGKTLWFGFWLNMLCTVFLVPTIFIDYKSDKQIKAVEEDRVAVLRDILIENDTDATGEEIEVVMKTKAFKCRDLKEYKLVFWINNLVGVFQMVVVSGYI